jgi:hypothetical protein
MKTTDLEEAIKEYFNAERAKESQFEHRNLHASDISNCTRRVWYRRTTGPEPVNNGFAMERGLRLEDMVFEALSYAYGETYYIHYASAISQYRGFIRWHPEEDTWEAGQLWSNALLKWNELELSIDGLAFPKQNPMKLDRPDAIFEVKSSMYVNPKEPRTENVVQAQVYQTHWEIRTGELLPTFVIETNGTEVYAHRVTEDNGIPQEQILQRIRERMTDASSEHLPAPSIPQERYKFDKRKGVYAERSYLCEGYCSYSVCSFHHSQQDKEVSEVRSSSSGDDLPF